MAIGVSLAVVLLVIQQIFQIDRDVFIGGYWIAAAVVLAGAALFNVLYNLSYQRKMRGIIALLDAGKPEEYIAGVEKLLQTAKGENLRNLLKLNLSAGYVEAKQYDAAIRILEELSGKRLVGAGPKMVHRLNLCMSYFYAAQNEKAMALYQESQKIFEVYRSDRNYGGNIAALDILAAIENKQYKQAEQMLDTARKVWEHPRLQSAFQKLGGFITERKAEDGEAEQ